VTAALGTGFAAVSFHPTKWLFLVLFLIMVLVWVLCFGFLGLTIGAPHRGLRIGRSISGLCRGLRFGRSGAPHRGLRIGLCIGRSGAPHRGLCIGLCIGRSIGGLRSLVVALPHPNPRPARVLHVLADAVLHQHLVDTGTAAFCRRGVLARHSGIVAGVVGVASAEPGANLRAISGGGEEPESHLVCFAGPRNGRSNGEIRMGGRRIGRSNGELRMGPRIGRSRGGIRMGPRIGRSNGGIRMGPRIRRSNSGIRMGPWIGSTTGRKTGSSKETKDALLVVALPHPNPRPARVLHVLADAVLHQHLVDTGTAAFRLREVLARHSGMVTGVVAVAVGANLRAIRGGGGGRGAGVGRLRLLGDLRIGLRRGPAAAAAARGAATVAVAVVAPNVAVVRFL